jgi:hypothetical protein
MALITVPDRPGRSPLRTVASSPPRRSRDDAQPTSAPTSTRDQSDAHADPAAFAGVEGQGSPETEGAKESGERRAREEVTPELERSVEDVTGDERDQE